MAGKKEAKKKGNVGIILWIIIFIAFVVIGYFGNQFASQKLIGHDVKLEVDTLKSQLKSINELATKRVDYREELEYKSDSIIGKDFVLTFDGIIKAGVNMDKAEISVKNSGDDVDTAVVTVKLPQAEVLSHEDTNANTVYESGWYEEDLGQLRNNLINETKQKREQKEIENGLLTDALEEAKTAIKSFIHKAYSSKVEVVFETV